MIWNSIRGLTIFPFVEQGSRETFKREFLFVSYSHTDSVIDGYAIPFFSRRWKWTEAVYVNFLKLYAGRIVISCRAFYVSCYFISFCILHIIFSSVVLENKLELCLLKIIKLIYQIWNKFKNKIYFKIIFEIYFKSKMTHIFFSL